MSDIQAEQGVYNSRRLPEEANAKNPSGVSFPAKRAPQTPFNLTFSRSLLCCTWGDDGAAALEPTTGDFAHVPAHTVEQVVE